MQRRQNFADAGRQMRVSIIQSCYVPWKGYFDLIGRCDLLVILDRAQFAKRHWHNRNRIMTPNGPVWLTIPVATKSRFLQAIDEVEIAEGWSDKHWRSIETAYGRATFFQREAPLIRSLYLEAGTLSKLTDVNELFLRALISRLDLRTKLIRDAELAAQGSRTERLLNICKEVGATSYLSGPSAKAYLDESLFSSAGIAVEWMSYGPYRAYPQRSPGFDQTVSILDTLFETGPEAASNCAPLAPTGGPDPAAPPEQIRSEPMAESR